MNKTKKYMIYISSILAMGEIYFYPPGSNLRFSAGIIALNSILLLSDDISHLFLTLSSGTLVVILRTILMSFLTATSISDAFLFNLPSLYYYIVFGFLIYVLDLKKHKNSFFETLFLLSSIDSIANIMESIIRGNLNSGLLKFILMIGFLRGIFSYLIFFLYKQRELFILNREHQKNYSQLNILVSNIQSEMFYLEKSMKDIERVMSKSYNLYHNYKDDPVLKESTLDISREIHEIKKDYSRVIKGFQNFLKNFENLDNMKLSKVFDIIKYNTNKYLQESSKSISIKFDLYGDFDITNYYNLFTILNNLIINSIDACSDGDLIKVSSSIEDSNVIFTVTDTGSGIDGEFIDLIFNPGFTTKFDQISGKPSTGIGLCHVKNILKGINGKINVESNLNKGTRFTITIPKIHLEGSLDNE